MTVTVQNAGISGAATVSTHVYKVILDRSEIISDLYKRPKPALIECSLYRYLINSHLQDIFSQQKTVTMQNADISGAADSE